MPEEPEIDTDKLHEAIQDELEYDEGAKLVRVIAVTTAIFAAIAAAAALLAGPTARPVLRGGPWGRPSRRARPRSS